LIPLSLLNILIVAIEVSVFARWDVEGVVSISIMSVVNWVTALFFAREWARRLGYRPEDETLRQPLLTQDIGGMQAARRLRNSV
jgi:hypothetical protein